jgi:hypothetical protein
MPPSAVASPHKGRAETKGGNDMQSLNVTIARQKLDGNQNLNLTLMTTNHEAGETITLSVDQLNNCDYYKSYLYYEVVGWYKSSNGYSFQIRRP